MQPGLSGALFLFLLKKKKAGTEDGIAAIKIENDNSMDSKSSQSHINLRKKSNKLLVGALDIEVCSNRRKNDVWQPHSQ